MKQFTVDNSDKSARDSLIELNLELKKGEGAGQRGMHLYPVFVKLLGRLDDELKFPLAAFSDETMLDEEFPGKHLWLGGRGGEDGTLCNKLLGRSDTGQIFYQNLEALMEVTGNGEVVEQYYLCLLCGFKGKYYSNPKARGRFIDAATEYLRREGQLTSRFLPEPIDEEPPPLPENLWWRRWETLNKRWLLVWFIAFLALKLVLLIFYLRPAMRELIK